MEDTDQNESYLTEMEDGDSVFIIDAHGDLKAYALPDDMTEAEMPANIVKIMKLFKNQRFRSQTIH